MDLTREGLDRFVLEHTTLVSPPLLPELRLHLATEVTPLWQATQAWLDDARIQPPFWAFAWVGGQALARFVLDRSERIRGKRVLDFAAGSGLVGIAAMRSGAASVTCADVDPLALRAAALNARANDVELELSGEDLVDRSAVLHRFDVVLAGDVCYEQPMADRVGAWLRRLARDGVEVVIGDPGRDYLLPKAALVELARFEVSSFADVESTATRSTGVFRVRP